ncbi:hypothetical protein IKG33_01970 [Candidatus Saccharibacteria bacterium]|nr:hypothetical protein [Candidatus Saccharibacteria bacterium]
MQKTEQTEVVKATHRRVQSSTTLDRRYVKKPMKSTDVMVPVRRSPKIKRFTSSVAMNKTEKQMDETMKVETHPIQSTANARLRQRKMSGASTDSMKKMTAKEIKDQAIQKALASTMKADGMETENTKKGRGIEKLHFSFGRVMLAMSCAVVVVLAIVYFVNLNMPDISLRVAAMQTGIEASYPNYVPRGYNLADIASENGRITLRFENGGAEDSFSLIEEHSSWDSNALLTNYVEMEYGDNYTVIKEQGLSLYISDSNAAWVNGGIVFKIKSSSNNLTKKQLKSIAVSL